MAIDEAKTPGAELTDQDDEGNFRRIVDSSEHGFCKECPAECHAIQASYQLATLPRFDRMRIAFFMERRIGIHHCRRDPGPAFGILGSRTGTMLEDSSKAGIEGHRELSGSKAALEAS